MGIEEQVFFSYAKVNVFLKIVGMRERYHELSSRFILVKSLFDEMYFVKKGKFESQPFVIEWNFGCEFSENVIWKAYLELMKFLKEWWYDDKIQKISEFINRYKLIVEKNIPIWGGLWWWSSNVATFLRMMNEILQLELSLGSLWQIGACVWADVNFFISGWDSANVRWVGEKIERFEEDILDIEIFTPKVSCDTRIVFEKYRETVFDAENIDLDFVRHVELMSTKEILTSFDIEQLNDLFEVSLSIYPELGRYSGEGCFFSGSGSSFFRVIR